MNRKTRAIIAATIVALGIGTMALGFLEDESTVRYVSDLYAADNGLHSGSYTLLGIPQPAQLPDGSNNTAHVGFTSTFRTNDTTITVIRTEAEPVPGGWRFTTTETDRGRNSSATLDVRTSNWTLEGDYRVFLVDDFEATGMRAWAAFGGVLNGDIQPKPSQLQGRLADGVPDGMLLWLVEPDGFTVGCSSKFLPDEVREDFDADGDGYTD